MKSKPDNEAKTGKGRVSHDAFFKELIEEFPADFLLILLPALIESRGGIRGVESLRQETDRKVLRSRGAIADTVIRYRFRKGEALLVIFEAQHDRHAFDIEKLMIYTLRLAKKFPGAEIIPVVIFTDRKKSRVPVSSKIEVIADSKTYLYFEFISVKLNEIDPASVSSKEGAFFRILEPLTRLEKGAKAEVVARCLAELYTSHPEVFAKYNEMLNHYIDLNEKESKEVDKIITKEKNMTSIFEPARQRGIAEGIKQGIQKGIQTGIKQGIQKGKNEGITEGIQKSIKQLIRIKFGKVPAGITKRIDKMDEKQLLKVQSRLFEADSPESLFEN